MHYLRTHKTLPKLARERFFICEIETCRYFFKTKPLLEQHMKRIHSTTHEPCKRRKYRTIRRYASKPGAIHCPTCNKPCADDSRLKRHIKALHGEKKFKCPRCNEGFCTQPNLKQHFELRQVSLKIWMKHFKKLFTVLEKH